MSEQHKKSKKRKKGPQCILPPPTKTPRNHIHLTPRQTNKENNNTQVETIGSLQEAQEIIRNYHLLLKQKEMIGVEEGTEGEREERLREMEGKMRELGGIERYQLASLYGEASRDYNTAVWVKKKLKHCFGLPGINWTQKLKVLDVGALNNHFKDVVWMDVTAIDLNPQDESVLKMDFFEFEEGNNFDVIVMSLVINCVGDVRKRGEMLKKAQALLREKGEKDKFGGILMMVLPLACIENSRYMNHELFVEMVTHLGFCLKEHKFSPKLAFYIFELERRGDVRKDWKKRILRKEGKLNNFSIVMMRENT